jgi:hypothetical protein
MRRRFILQVLRVYLFEHKGKIRIRRLHPCFRSGLDNNFFYTNFHLGEGNIGLLAALHLAGVHVVEGHHVVTHVVAEWILVVVFRLKK